MRQGQQNRRGRGRGGSSSNNSSHSNSNSNPNNNRKSGNPLSRSYESSGPDVKIRGTASQIAEKYTTLARDASSAGDVIMAENYLQHAEHYNRIIMAAQAQTVQPSAHNGSDAGHALNGMHRGHREPNGAMRDQPQPHVNGEAMPPEMRQPAPVVAVEQPAREPMPPQPMPPQEQPVVEADMFPQIKAEAATEKAEADAEPGRRRRRRYPTGTATARGAAAADGSPDADEKPAKAKAAAGEEPQPSDEATTV
jgi:hypothetical protein